MASKPPDAFLSYTRFDDENDGGAISEFRRRLASAVRAVTGEPFEIFQDVDGIGLGEQWRGKLDEILDETRFFIPIVTPSYFKSKACREELEKFLRAEAERGRNDLILPMYYIESYILEKEELRASDALATLIHERQRQDWRDLRFESFDAKEVRRALERLAREIARSRSRPMPSPSAAQAEQISIGPTEAPPPASAPPPPGWILRILNGSLAGHSIQLYRLSGFQKSGVIKVGRDRKWADIPIADEGVSRQHVRIRLAGGGLELIDMESRNGTTVGGHRLPPNRPLEIHAKTKVKVGPIWMVLEPA
jgi:hypothetical protein